MAGKSVKQLVADQKRAQAKEKKLAKELAAVKASLKKLGPAIAAAKKAEAKKGAGKKKAKAGEISENVYTDDKYGFQMNLHENWKAKVGDEKDKTRLVLTQRNYDIPPKYLNAPDYTKVPRLVVYVTKSDLSAPVFIDSLTNRDYKSDLKNEVLKEIEFLNEPDIVPKGKSRMELSGSKGSVWQGQSKYMKEVQASASSSRGERVYGNYGGAVYAFDHGGYLVLIGLMAEWEFYETVLGEVDSMVKSLQFTPLEG